MNKYGFDSIKFAKDLHSERWGRGEGVREVAANLGCSASTVSRWERALNEPPIVIFLVACGHYGLNPLDYIMEVDNSQPVMPGFEALVQPPMVAINQAALPGMKDWEDDEELTPATDEEREWYENLPIDINPGNLISGYNS